MRDVQPAFSNVSRVERVRGAGRVYKFPRRTTDRRFYAELELPNISLIPNCLPVAVISFAARGSFKTWERSREGEIKKWSIPGKLGAARASGRRASKQSGQTERWNRRVRLAAGKLVAGQRGNGLSAFFNERFSVAKRGKSAGKNFHRITRLALLVFVTK